MTSTETKLLPEQLANDYEQYKVGKSTSFSGPSAANRCSVLGHPCTAYCFYDRTVDPIDRVKISAGLASIFAEGRDQERIFQRDLLEMGYDVKQQQGSLSWPEYNITGHRDFEIARAGSTTVDCEFKSVHPLLWEQLKTVEDVKNHKSYFIKKWYYQTVLYMLLKGQKEYWLIMKNKSSGRIKTVVFEWDDETWEDAERMTKKAQTVNNLVKIGLVRNEDKLSDADVCDSCEFLTICNPPLDFGPGVDILDEETAAELDTLADRREELEAAASEYDDVDGELKGRIKAFAGTEKNQVVFGEWSAAVRRQIVKPEAKPRAGFTKTLIKFARLKKDGDGK